ncbi:MAG: glycosyltransferase family 2 protein [Deltaproteobacteria bacterium]|nr:glycosyltransferase family 2 protein [Deltaproteobacteria bacterium]
MNRPRLTIIVVNWNTVSLLRDCLTSLLRKEMGITHEIIVVDNASADGSPQMVAATFPSVRLICNNENRGFAKANNQAIKEAQGDYILLLNSDTVVPDNRIFMEWLSFMDRHPEAGASGCKLIKADGAHWVGDAGFKPSLGTIFGYSFFLSKLFPGSFKGLFLNYHVEAAAAEVDWISGAAFLVRRTILPEVGLLDENVFMYAEDVEWGCRIRSKGYKIFYLPGLVIIHLVGASTKKHKEGIFSHLWIENLRRLYQTFNPSQPLFLFDFIFAAGLLLRSFLYLVVYMASGKDKWRYKSKEMFSYFSFLALKKRT